MTLIVDTGPVVAAADRRDPRRAEAQRALREEPGPLVLPAPVTAEVDHLLRSRVGRTARAALLADLAQGRFVVACPEPGDHEQVATLERRYADLVPSLADLSVVVAAKRFETTRLLSFDERDFRTMCPLQGGAFTLLPADS